MNLAKFTLTSLIISMLVACGGGSPGQIADSESGDISVGTPDIGNGVGSDYSDALIGIDETVLVGGQLAAGGDITINVDIVDRDSSNARIAGTEYGVIFSSTCASAATALASFGNVEHVTSSGTVTTTYSAEGCAGTDTITAVLYNTSDGATDQNSPLATATVNIDVVSPTVNSISYVSASESSLGIASVGNENLKQSSLITFSVTDINGDPVASKEVDFSLSSASGSGSAYLTKDSALTGSDGQVSVILNAGSTQTVVRVGAIINFTNGDGDADSSGTFSIPIAIGTGLPVQDGMTISASIFNPMSIEEVGTEVSITAYLNDRYGNSPPDGTVINFTTEGGTIASPCKTTNGTCSVIWKSQNPIPGLGEPDVLALKVNEIVGFSTVMAYTQGDAFFSDSNGNGAFDVGEGFVAYGEAFRDDDYSGDRDDKERFIDSNNDAVYKTKADAVAEGVYQGSLCSEGAIALGHCAANMIVNKSLRLVMSGEAKTVRVFTLDAGTYTEVNFGGGEEMDSTKEHYVVIQDTNGNIPANGTSVSFNADGLEITSDTGDVQNSNGLLDMSIGLPEAGAAYKIRFADEDNSDNPGSPVLEVTISRVIDDNGDLTFQLPLSNVAAP